MSGNGATVTRGGVELLAEHLLIRTGPVDHGAWNYRPVLGWLQRQRFRMIVKLIGSRRFGDLLEIGYGSALFAPELIRRCDRYVGIDIHQKNKDVERVLESVGLSSVLHAGSVSAMPLESNSIDCMVAVSVFEFVEDIELACEEMVPSATPERPSVRHCYGRLTIVGSRPEAHDRRIGGRRLRRQTLSNRRSNRGPLRGRPHRGLSSIQGFRHPSVPGPLFEPPANSQSSRTYRLRVQGVVSSMGLLIDLPDADAVVE